MAGPLRTVLETLEEGAAPDPSALPVQLVYVASEAVEIDPGELAGAVRRAMLVLAAGGDPHRDLVPSAPAVTTLAADLDAPDRRGELEAGLAAVDAEADGLPHVSSALGALKSDPEAAWSLLACVLLAEALAE